MLLNKAQVVNLLRKRAMKEEFTSEERLMLATWCKESPQHNELAEQFGDEQWVDKALEKLEQAPKELWAALNRRLDDMGAPPLETCRQIERPHIQGRVLRKRLWLSDWMSIAPILILVVSLYLFWSHLAHNRETARGLPLANVTRDEQVIWTTSEGQKIDVTGIAVGKVVDTTGNRTLRKVDTNALAYDPAPEKPVNIWNCLAVGKNCCCYHLRMPDGSAVWLAGGSTLQYPLNNRAADHPATFSGRGYFDVIKDTARPWVINMPGGGRIEVHRAIFVAEAGTGQQMHVALFNGKLKVFQGSNGKELHSDEEAIEQQHRMVVQKIKAPAAAIAWVQPWLSFHFYNTTLDDALQQVASWYGYTVRNEDRIRGMPLTDDVWRPATIDRVVQAISQMEIYYASISIEGQEIIVSPVRTVQR